MAGSSAQPNILFVMADQLAPQFTGAYEHPVVRTPAMDALVERGVRFDTAYYPYPLCAPSRYSMLTGRPATAIGAWNNAADRMDWADAGPRTRYPPVT